MAPAIEIFNLLICSSVHPGQAPQPYSAFSTLVSDTKLDAKACRHDVQVQRAMAAFLLALSLIRGVLGAFTVSFWTLLSDRIGRKPVQALALFGFLCSDLAVIIVVRNYQTLSYKLVILSSVVEGSLGGYSTVQAVFGAYASDSTPTGSRAKVFSILCVQAQRRADLAGWARSSLACRSVRASAR